MSPFKLGNFFLDVDYCNGVVDVFFSATMQSLVYLPSNDNLMQKVYKCVIVLKCEFNYFKLIIQIYDQLLEPFK